MLKSYFNMAWRSLQKNKISSVINIGGLAIGLATGIIIMLVVVDEFSYDKFHANREDIYMLLKNQQHMDGVSTGESTAGPMAATFRLEIPETKYAARLVYTGDQLVKTGEKVTYEPVMYADPDLFKMMSFPVLEGNPAEALRDARSVVITERTAKKLFGQNPPMGQTIVLNNTQVMKVGAVVRDVPSNSSIQFDMVLPFQVFERGNDWLKKWDDNRIQTWVQLKPSANIPALNAKLTKMLQERSDDKTVSLFVYPFTRMHLYGSFEHGKPNGGRINMVWMLALLGIFLLLIACINFMNISTARCEHRAREVGVRKVLGASRKRIIFQFLSEAMMMTFLALALGVLLAEMMLPFLNGILEKPIPFDFGNWQLWMLLPAVGLITGLVAGSYPSLFLSRFKPAKVIKGIQTDMRGAAGIRRLLVTIQFVISIGFIIGTIVLYAQINFVKNRPIGYEQNNLLEIRADDGLAGKFNLFKDELAKIPGVNHITAGADNILGFGGGVTGMDWPGKQPGQELSILITEVQYNWTKTMGIKLKEGRDFDPVFGTDTSACLINETAVAKMGLKEPVIGAKIGGKPVIGVFQNFVFNNPSGGIAPMAVYLNTGRLNHFYVSIRNDGNWRQTYAKIEKTVHAINPDYPVNFSFTKEDYQRRFEEWSSYGKMATLFGCLAIFISCLGLFGLSVFLAERRSKEMSIRKVLGATIWNVWLSLSRDFLKPVLIALLVVMPFAIWASHYFLSNIVYHVQISWWMFTLAGALAIIIAITTVSYQGFRTALENPANRLKEE
ncbi:ABC transporter permease [Flavitalea flava]